MEEKMEYDITENQLATKFKMSYTTLKKIRLTGQLDGTYESLTYVSRSRTFYNEAAATPILNKILRRA